MTDTATTTRTPERTRFLGDVLTAAVEGGIGYWASTTAYHWDTEAHPEKGQPYVDLVDEESTEDGEEPVTHHVDLDRIEAALAAMTTPGTVVKGLHPNWVGQIASANATNGEAEVDIDADLADSVVQYAVFGEVVYG